jgi:flagellin-like hook-associated protein FlgL
VILQNLYAFDAGNHTLDVEFVADNVAQVLVDGVAVGATVNVLLNGGTIDLSAATFTAAFGGVDPLIDILYADDGGDETGNKYSFALNQVQSLTIASVNDTLTGVTYSGGTLDLGDAQFQSLFLGNADPGIDLNITDASQAASNGFTVELRAPRLVDITSGGTTASNIDISLGVVSLNGAAFNDIFTGGNPNVALNFANTFNGVDDVYTVNLNTATTVDITDSNGALVGSDIDVSGGVLALDVANVGNATGVSITLTDANKGIDDTFTVDLTRDKTVEVFLDTVSQGVHSIAGGSLDLSTVLAKDPGFDLDIAADNFAINGVDDLFRFDLTRDFALSSIAETQLLDVEVRSMEVGDEFQVDASAGTLETGLTFSQTVEAPTLEVGTQYSVVEDVGTFQLNDVIKINAAHAFQTPLITLQATTDLQDGLELQLQNGNFEIGDEIRFQARGYLGDFTPSGPFTNPAFPDRFEVEVVTSGAVDGGAQIKYILQDNPGFQDLANIRNATTAPELLQDNVKIAFSAGTLFAGDKFFIDTVSALSQNFGGGVTLESSDTIKVEYDVADTDNILGRLLYVGDPALADQSGTLGNLTAAFLGVNSESTVSNLNLMSQTQAEESIRVIDEALSQVSGFRSNVGATQNRIEHQIRSLSMAELQTENYVSRIRDADLAIEVAEMTAAQIREQSGISILRQMSLIPELALSLIQNI